MGKFTAIPQDTFQGLQTNAGILLKKFNPETGEFQNTDIICATTGGINPTCVPTYSDYGEDVDNCPVNTMELKQLDGWECKIGFTSLGMSPDAIRLSLGAADIDKTTGKITPRRNVKLTDYADLWWVGDKANGGMLAIRLINALSTGGFSLQTTKNGKGQNSCIKFLKTANPLNGRTSVVFATYTARNGYARAVDILEDGSMDPGSVITDGTNYTELLYTNEADHANNPGKLPLLPLNVLGRETTEVYHYPMYFGLPDAALNTAVNQVEVEISGRRFIVTDRDTYADGNICLGLIEVTD